MAETDSALATKLWELIHEHRKKVGDFLATLNEDEWNAPSLDAGWRVRDVAAHLIQTHLITQANLVSDWVRSGFSLKARNDLNVKRRKSMSTAELLREYRETSTRTSYLPGQLTYSLIEVVIHGEDMARALHKSIDVNPEALIKVADLARITDPILGGKRRTAGLSLLASDVEWAAGDGPEVKGPLIAIVLAITGRPAGLDDLNGAGVQTLRSRL
jgi:uncharacterized protein (TIGR03083 family)